mgnify:CR=1 FL=1
MNIQKNYSIGFVDANQPFLKNEEMNKKRKRDLLSGNIDEQEILQVTKKALMSRKDDNGQQKQVDSPFFVVDKPTFNPLRTAQ